MLKIYLYPNIQLDNSRSMNPYINRLSEALSIHYQVVNRDSPMKIGVFDILKYSFSFDIVFLNWIEDLPEKRGGNIQSIFFIMIFYFLKAIGKKVIWTLHNKKSHSKKHKIFKRVLFNLMLKRSDLVITHANEGLKLIPQKTTKVHIPHPVGTEHRLNDERMKKIYDIIFWGAVTEYKGIDTFLSYLIEKNHINKFKILIAGKVVGSRLNDTLKNLDSEYDNITLLNRFIEKDELAELIKMSKIILFSYHSDSILSSGALMDSLGYNSVIVGPDVGSFSDLRKEGLVYTFGDFNELILLLTTLIKDYKNKVVDLKRIRHYVSENNWKSFSDSISIQISSLFSVSD